MDSLPTSAVGHQRPHQTLVWMWPPASPPRDPSSVSAPTPPLHWSIMGNLSQLREIVAYRLRDSRTGDGCALPPDDVTSFFRRCASSPTALRVTRVDKRQHRS